MKIKLTETEKDRIRGMHAQYSSVQEQEQIQTNIDGIEMPEIEIPKDCMTCVTKALKKLWEIAEDISPAHVILIGPKLMSCGRKCMVSTIIDNSKDFVLGRD